MRNDPYPSRTSTLTAYTILPRHEPVMSWMPRCFTETQATQYVADGFLQLAPFVSMHGLIEQAQAAAKQLHAAPPTQGVIYEPGDSRRVRSVFAAHRMEPFATLGRHPVLVDLARSIVGGPVYLHQSRINYKAGANSTGWGWHSDFETWHVEDGMPGMRAVTVMVALTENTASNGPLMLIPGSHRSFLACVGTTPEGNYEQHLQDQKIGMPDEASLQHFIAEAGGRIEVVTCPAGALVVFDSNCLHGSSTNIAPAWRMNLFYVYNAVTNRLEAPFAGTHPRPEYVATREGCVPL